MTINSTIQLEVCESLIREHRQMEVLLAQLELSLNSEKRDDIRSTMAQIEPEMNTHFACEEQVLFPAVSPYHPMVLMEAEHEELVALRQNFLEQLGQASQKTEDLERLKATGIQFISDMLDHIGREDFGIFPACERALSNTEKQAVIEGMAQLRTNAKTEPAPSITRPERRFQAFQLNLVNPAQRKVFSERLFHDDNLEMKHLVIQAGESIPSHWAPKQGTLVCLSGQGTFRANDLESELKPGSTIVMSPQLLHSIQAETDIHLLLLLL